MNLDPLVVIGGGGHAREVVGLVTDVNRHSPAFELLGFVADGQWDEALLSGAGLTRLGDVSAIGDMDVCYVIAIGDGAARRRIANDLAAARCRPVDLIHPFSVIGPRVSWGRGFIAFPGVVVTADVRFGRHVHLNVGATISHDCVLEDFVTVGPGCHLAGRVHAGEQATFGVGASAAPGSAVGARATVGAGAVVVGAVDDGATVVGVPAKPLNPPLEQAREN